MKILSVNTNDTVGGAARAAYRLHIGMTKIGLDSTMLVQRKQSDDYNVIGPITKYHKITYRMRPYLDAIPTWFYKGRAKTLFSPAWLPGGSIANKINYIKPDIVHLHWIAGGLIRIEDLVKIKSPIVWTLHDMWPFTGGCHTDNGCGKYISKCGQCPVLGSRKSKDLSYSVFRRKEQAFQKLNNLVIVGPSNWIKDCAQKSKILSNILVINIPNPIDTDSFKPIGKKVARDILNLPTQKKLILYGAMGAYTDPNKGFNLLEAALKTIDLNNAELAVFGASRPLCSNDLGLKVHYFGRLHDDISLSVLYSAADVMVVPSIQESFGQTATEAMACGVPVLAFNATGLKDIVDHKLNGYLALPYEPSDLAQGLEWIINHPSPESLSVEARKKVLDCFELEKVARRYKALYEEILNS